MIIRSSTKADFSAVDALLARTYPKLLKADYPPSVLVTALPIISRARPELVGCPTYFVAEEDGAILGAGGWTPDAKDASKGHIRHLVTDDRHLRRGIARSLMQHSFDTARSAGVSQMECWSTHTAVPFYESVGFISIGLIEVPLGAAITFPSVRMMRSL